MSTHCQSAIAKPEFSTVAWHRRLAAAVRATVAWSLRCRERSAQRRALAQLDDRLLRDLGLDRTDVAAECGKAFWVR